MYLYHVIDALHTINHSNVAWFNMIFSVLTANVQLLSAYLQIDTLFTSVSSILSSRVFTLTQQTVRVYYQHLPLHHIQKQFLLSATLLLELDSIFLILSVL